MSEEARSEPAAEEPQASPLRELGRRLRYWSPLFALMLLFAEIGLLGLRPALAESRRLDVSGPAVAERYTRALEQRDATDTLLRARSDPVYRERLRRRRLYPADGR